MYTDILDSFVDEMNTDAYMITVVNTYNETTGGWAEVETVGSAIKCIFWEGGAGKSLLSDSMRERVSAVAVFSPTATVNGLRMKINNKTYSVLNIDNVANQNAAIVVALGEIA